MSDKLLDILKEHDDLSEQELMNYLMGHLTPQERQEIEQRLASSEMMSDAEEGLSQVKNKEQLNYTVAQINKQLTNQLKERRKRKSRWEKPNQNLIIVATFVILVLIVIAFMVIMKMRTG
jgi:anti-sigma factor RsiW